MKTKMTTEQATIPQELRDRACAVGFHVDTTRTSDGTYWIPSIGHWRSIQQIEQVVVEREEHPE